MTKANREVRVAVGVIVMKPAKPGGQQQIGYYRHSSRSLSRAASAIEQPFRAG